MKKEQFYELLGDVDEKAVKAAENPPAAKSKKPWIKFGAIAAACLVAIAGASIGYKILNSKPATVLETAKRKKMLLSAAVYPEMPTYPNERDYINDNRDDWEAHAEALWKWREARWALRDQPEGYTDGFDVFFANSARVFLSDRDADTKTANKIYSPLSLYMALGMSAEITDGNTRQQILDALAQDDIDTLRTHARSIWQANYLDDGIAKCVLATSLWTNNNIGYNSQIVNSLSDNYYSSVFTGDPGTEEYNQLLQAWINEQTDGLLEDYVSGVEMTPETVLALVATVNYSGQWDSKFLKENNEQALFHTPDGDVQCEFMNTADNTDYYWGEKFSSVALDLEDNGQMRFILPDEGVSIEELLNDKETLGFMNMHNHDGDYPNRRYVQVNFSVPKFDVSSETDLMDGLRELGITDIFDPAQSDFRPLSDSVDTVWLDKATQASRVIIDEEGCKAASFTAMLDAGATPPTEEVDFVLDRPFIFELVSENSLPLFVGVVNNPVG